MFSLMGSIIITCIVDASCNPVQTGATALIIACEMGHKDITVLLLSAKANIDHQNKVNAIV